MVNGGRPPSKQQLIERLITQVRADFATLQRSHEESALGVTHDDARQEGDKDMRSTEASYVARGQAQRVVDLQNALAALEALNLRSFASSDPVALGALVTVEFDRGEIMYFVVPAAGGPRLSQGRWEVRVITPQSPLGQVLLGRVVGDDVSWETPQGDAEGVIVDIA